MALEQPVERRSTASSSRMSIASCSKAPGRPAASAAVSASGSSRRPQPTTVGAEPGQLQRRLPPQAAAGAGDDADLPVEQARR